MLVGALMLAAPGVAQAGYAAPVASDTGCLQYYNSGGRDAAGTLYTRCSAMSILAIGANGSITHIPINRTDVAHVAPSPDGRYLYDLSASVRRFVRTDAGFAYDPTFTVEVPPGWAAHGWTVCGWGIATDGYGDIYVSNGGWCVGNPNTILKYTPDGRLITSFGDYGVAGFQGDAPGLFRPAMTIAVTADGSRLWIADELNFRVQFFDRTADATTYQYAGMWSGEGTRWTGSLGAVYGVALDPWGYAYVTQTTTMNIWRLDPDGTNPVQVGSSATWRPHTVAVDGRGRVYVGEWGQRIDRTDAVPGPIPALPPKPRVDVADPVLTSVTTTSTTTGANVRVSIVATDDIQVVAVRTASEFGDDWTAWGAFQSPLTVQLTAGLGPKRVYVQVRDAAGKDSAVLSVATARGAAPDLSAPVVVLSGPVETNAATIPLTIDARDDIGVTHLRLADESGTWGAWLSWTNGVATVQHPISAGYGTRIVFVQARDASWKESEIVRWTVVVPAPRAPDPAPVSTLPRPTPTPLPTVPSGGGGSAAPMIARDTIAPRLISAKAPFSSCGRRITLKIQASDNTRVSFIRIANEDGRFGRWLRYRTVTTHLLSARIGRKSFSIQVRDSSGNISRTTTRRTLVKTCALR